MFTLVFLYHDIILTQISCRSHSLWQRGILRRQLQAIASADKVLTERLHEEAGLRMRLGVVLFLHGWVAEAETDKRTPRTSGKDTPSTFIAVIGLPK